MYGFKYSPSSAYGVVVVPDSIQQANFAKLESASMSRDEILELIKISKIGLEVVIDKLQKHALRYDRCDSEYDCCMEMIIFIEKRVETGICILKRKLTRVFRPSASTP